MAKVMPVGDLHLPWNNKAATRKVIAAIAREQPDYVIQIGDLADQYVFSRFTKDSNITTYMDVERGLKQGDDFWKAVHKAAPRAKRIQVLGNHDVRITKRIADKIPELASLYGIHDLYKFPGVKVLESDRDYYEVDGVVYTHGWFSSSIAHARYFNKPTVHGHRHRPEIVIDGPRLWSMDVGYLADKTSLPMQYTASRYSKWKMSYAIVNNGQPNLYFLEEGDE